MIVWRIVLDFRLVMAALRELLPCPRPYCVEPTALTETPSVWRSVRSRHRRVLHEKVWTNEAVDSLDQLYGTRHVESESQTFSLAQRRSINHIREQISHMGAPTCTATEAVRELCGQRPGYEDPGPCAPFDRGKISLPNCGGLVDGGDILTGQVLNLWKDWKREIWSPSEHLDGSLVKRHSDPKLVRRPRVYA